MMTSFLHPGKTFGSRFAATPGSHPAMHADVACVKARRRRPSKRAAHGTSSNSAMRLLAGFDQRMLNLKRDSASRVLHRLDHLGQQPRAAVARDRCGAVDEWLDPDAGVNLGRWRARRRRGNRPGSGRAHQRRDPGVGLDPASACYLIRHALVLRIAMVVRRPAVQCQS